MLACFLFPAMTVAAPICTVMADAKSGEVLLREGSCDRRLTPASTFKIALSLMGYDSGFLKNEQIPALPFRAGYPDWIPSWKATTTPEAWMKNSVVWYSQQIAGSLGMPRFESYVQRFGYGNKDVSGGLTQAWLTSSLQISPVEQLDFLRKIVGRQLPVSTRAYEMTNRITAIAQLPSGWAVHGKTGSGFTDSSHQVGWFVGWAIHNDQARVFAHCIEEEARPSTRAGLLARDQFMERLPDLIDTRKER
jgi:beta-lactamase class D